MPKASNRWKGCIVTKSTYEKRLAQQKSGKTRRKTVTSRPNDEIVDHNAPTYVEEQPDIIDGRRVV
jgi:hypothetical protein